MKHRSSWTQYIRTLVPVVVTLLSIATGVRAQETGIAPEGFHVGDRIALTVEGPTPISDTVVVREGQILRFPTIGDISLVGVRRADIEKYLTQQFGKFIRDPVVHATPLVRIAVLGQIGRPGFYTLPSDTQLSDVIMRAGGPGGDADLNKTVVKRRTQVVIPAGPVSKALANGQTLDDLRVAPGDELVIGEQSHVNFETVLRIAGVVVPLGFLLLSVFRH